MTLEIIHRECEGIEILDLKGPLTLGQGDLDFRNELARLVETTKFQVALNLSHLDELDSTGVATLLFARQKLRKFGGSLAIYNLQPSHLGLLAEAQLETELEVFPTEQDAINSFFPGRAIKPYDVLAFVESI
jgi:anti-anti-sigma factor